ncbi:MAG: hypothetical protein LBE79_09600 [Tannerella sp.]|jgi:hypothetical protein|nr:hypothetical protein [Tannerella sp.]
METTTLPQVTPEIVWAAIHALGEKQAETALQMKETDRRMKETDRLVQETALQMKETDRRMQELQKSVGGITNNQGAFAEEYFFNSFEKGEKNFFGEKFDEISKHLKNRRKGIEDEYDIVMYNHAAVAIIEVKYKAHVNDIPAILNKAETFRILFPDYKDYKIYLGFASMSFYPELEQECIQQGIAIIKQVGDTVVINDVHLKVF